jgi:hypothetical protein
MRGRGRAQVLGSMLCVVSLRETGLPPYVVENVSSSPLRIYQADAPKSVKLVRPYQAGLAPCHDMPKHACEHALWERDIYDVSASGL